MNAESAEQLVGRFDRMTKDDNDFGTMERKKILRIPFLIIVSDNVDLESFLATFKILKDTGYDNHPILVAAVIDAWCTAFPDQKGSVLQCIYALSSLYDRSPTSFAVIIEGLIISLCRLANSNNLITAKTALSLILHEDFVETMYCASQTPAGMDALSTEIRSLSVFPSQEVAGKDQEDVTPKRIMIYSFLEKLAYGTEVELTYDSIPATPVMLKKGVLNRSDNSLATVLVNELVSKLMLNLTPEKKVEAFFALKLKI